MEVHFRTDWGANSGLDPVCGPVALTGRGCEFIATGEAGACIAMRFMVSSAAVHIPVEVEGRRRIGAVTAFGGTNLPVGYHAIVSLI